MSDTWQSTVALGATRASVVHDLSVQAQHVESRTDKCPCTCSERLRKPCRTRPKCEQHHTCTLDN
eukprot:6177847-Pleurochrysis_carterae.AAC.3